MIEKMYKKLERQNQDVKDFDDVCTNVDEGMDFALEAHFAREAGDTGDFEALAKAAGILIGHDSTGAYELEVRANNRPYVEIIGNLYKKVEQSGGLSPENIVGMIHTRKLEAPVEIIVDGDIRVYDVTLRRETYEKDYPSRTSLEWTLLADRGVADDDPLPRQVEILDADYPYADYLTAGKFGMDLRRVYPDNDDPLQPRVKEVAMIATAFAKKVGVDINGINIATQDIRLVDDLLAQYELEMS